MPPILEVSDLKTYFDSDAGEVRAVDGASFALAAGETLALVGESGSGKSVTALSILRLLQSPPARIAGGSIRFDGRDLLSLSESEMRAVRGADIAMIFQEPMTALNPVFTVGGQVVEALRAHRKLRRHLARAEALELLERVGIADARSRFDSYPHQLSGGMRQRVMIAMALAGRPRVLIADEPTTALDVTIQAQVLDLIASLRKELAMSVLLITHDLGVVAETADRVAVMYAGRIVEEAPVKALFEQPLHPYARGLIESTPRLDHMVEGHGRLKEIPGLVPSPLDRPAGCAFAPRCPLVEDHCRAAVPGLAVAGRRRRVACFVAQRELGRKPVEAEP